MAVKTTAIKSHAATTAPPVKAGNAKTVQRKILPGLRVLPSPVQRKEQPGSWLHRQSQKPVNSRSLIQPKVKVHASNDHFEKEADHIADKVVSNVKPSSPMRVSAVSTGAQRKCASCEKEEVQAMHVQRKCSSCEDKESVQKKTSDTTKHMSDTLHSSDSGPPTSREHSTNHSLDAVLSSQSTRGSPLPDATRTQMESRMGADFSKVRIHTGSDSHDASTSIGARAFTNGGNIHFAKGEFAPQTKTGKHLLAHELAHTMQQGAAPAKEISGGASPVKGLRKVVPKPKYEKKIARLSSPYDNQESSQKDAQEEFSRKFKNKKAPRLSSSVFKKEKGKKLNKDPVALPGKEKKKQEQPPKTIAKPRHLLNVKNQHSQISQLSSKGINFKPQEDKKAEEDPVQKAQSLQSKKISENVLSKASQSAASMADTIARVRPRLMNSSSKAIARIKANEAAQKEIIATDIKAQKAATKKAMQSAAGSISAYHKKTTGDLKNAAKTARDDISKAKTKNTTAINLAALLQTPVILKAYVQAQKDFEASGRSVGNECSSRSSQRSWNEFISKMKHEDDSLLDGPYTDDMKQARGDAAVKVGDGYKEGITKAGVDQGKEIYKGMPNDLKKVNDAREEMLKYVNESYDTALKAIDDAEKSGIEQADGTKKSMLSSVYKQHKAAQAKLDLTQKTQTQLTEVLSLKQCQQIELQAEQAIESMEEGGSQSLMHLNNGFKEYKQVCESMNSPPPVMLLQKLMPIEASLAQNAPAMAASLQKGMMQTEAGFNKTANETITTTNTTVTQSLAEAKLDNDKAIDGLKKLQQGAIRALQETFNKNKQTITTTASQTVTNIQAIKSAFDDILTNIAADLVSGLKTGAEQLKQGLTDTIDKGSGETKSLLAKSQEEEEKAADEVSPRWKSVLKVLLIIVVTLLIALVVGPAVIGFISAAAGGGLFGAAVGAVVGGAILGAASSAVITIGNNLIDGKTWYKGVGAAMLEGAITGAIGGAFGAAGSGIAGKFISTAAKGIGPALGRFAIQQTIDLAGNITTEYVSSKLQGKPFSWAAVAQGQAIGVGMHIGMGGLGALKDVKGFKTINKISEGAGKLGERFGNKVSGRPPPVVEPHMAPVKTEVEEPHGKGQSAPKEEPHGGSKPVEETKTTPKEEPTSKAPKEETAPAKPKEEPTGTAPKEEGTPGKPKEEPGSSKAAPEEKKPSNLTQQEIDDGIAAKHPTEDGHNMKVSENGTLVKCSNCELVDFNKNPYKDSLPEAKQKEFGKEWEGVQKETNPELKAKKAAEFDAKLNAELDLHLKPGAKAAKKLGLPPAEEGYHWKVNGEGDPIYSNNPKNDGKQRVYDKDKQAFVDADTKPAAKPDIEAKYKTDAEGKPIKESVDTQQATSKEAAEVKKAHEERAKAKEDKDKFSKGTDEYNEKNKEMIDKSEKMGEASADAYMKEKHGLTPEYTGSGSRTVDKMYVGKDGKVYVVEAKGGSSGLGTKVSTEGATKGKVLQQGTKEYLEQTVREMRSSGVQEKIDAANKIDAAMKSGDLVYLHASQKVGPNGELVPVGVKEFNVD